jgi:hypothetical protein
MALGDWPAMVSLSKRIISLSGKGLVTSYGPSHPHRRCLLVAGDDLRSLETLLTRWRFSKTANLRPYNPKPHHPHHASQQDRYRRLHPKPHPPHKARRRDNHPPRVPLQTAPLLVHPVDIPDPPQPEHSSIHEPDGRAVHPAEAGGEPPVAAECAPEAHGPSMQDQAGEKDGEVADQRAGDHR